MHNADRWKAYAKGIVREKKSEHLAAQTIFKNSDPAFQNRRAIRSGDHSS